MKTLKGADKSCSISPRVLFIFMVVIGALCNGPRLFSFAEGQTTVDSASTFDPFKPRNEPSVGRTGTDAEEEYRIGWSILHGGGRKYDTSRALEHFKLSAAQGYAPAQSIVGRILLKGEGVPADEKAGLLWLRQAASQGNRLAAEMIAQANVQEPDATSKVVGKKITDSGNLKHAEEITVGPPRTASNESVTKATLTNNSETLFSSSPERTADISPTTDPLVKTDTSSESVVQDPEQLQAHNEKDPVAGAQVVSSSTLDSVAADQNDITVPPDGAHAAQLHRRTMSDRLSDPIFLALIAYVFVSGFASVPLMLPWLTKTLNDPEMCGKRGRRDGVIKVLVLTLEKPLLILFGLLGWVAGPLGGWMVVYRNYQNRTGATKLSKLGEPINSANISTGTVSTPWRTGRDPVGSVHESQQSTSFPPHVPGNCPGERGRNQLDDQALGSKGGS